jgi:hypothetical protein
VHFSVFALSGVGEDFTRTSLKERIPLFFDTMHVKQKVLNLAA